MEHVFDLSMIYCTQDEQERRRLFNICCQTYLRSRQLQMEALFATARAAVAESSDESGAICDGEIR